LCALIPWNLAVGDWAIALATIPLLLLALWRYIDRRSKSVMQAYWYVITLEASRKDGFREEAETLVDGFTHAGGVVFRRSGDGAEYLLVQAKNKPQEWVLPKGHIETGEPMRETAVREVLEEAGVWARVIGDLDEISFSVSGDSVSVKFFLMEALEEEKAKPSDERKREWLTFEAALDRAKHDQTKDLLRLAERKMIAP
jgi:ADP-ribose pyrophosphatase YjhB (NUDIX family)